MIEVVLLQFEDNQKTISEDKNEDNFPYILILSMQKPNRKKPRSKRGFSCKLGAVLPDLYQLPCHMPLYWVQSYSISKPKMVQLIKTRQDLYKYIRRSAKFIVKILKFRVKRDV